MQTITETSAKGKAAVCDVWAELQHDFEQIALVEWARLTEGERDAIEALSEAAYQAAEDGAREVWATEAVVFVGQHDCSDYDPDSDGEPF